MSKRESLVQQADRMIGTYQGSAEHQQLVNDYNSINPLPNGYRMSTSQPWCALFVSACAWRAGISDFPFECSCPRMINLFRNRGQWVENDGYVPQQGDIIFYDWQDSGVGDNVGEADHVGIVEGCDNGKIFVIEGNMSNAVGRRTIAVNGRYIRGFGLPFGDSVRTETLQTTDSGTADAACPAASATADGKSYTVKKGDTLYGICKAVLGDSSRAAEVAKLNGIDNPSRIYVGQVLTLPDGEEQPEDGYYRVKEGDTLWAICERELGDANLYKTIADKNGISYPGSIYPGQLLKLWDSECEECKL